MKRKEGKEMGISRTVTTEVFCDNCGGYIAGWLSDCKYSNGVSREWAKYFARLRGCTTGKKVICKQCRIKKRMEKCRLLHKADLDAMHSLAAMLAPQETNEKFCLGLCNEGDDEPIEQCKKCIAHCTFDWEEERRRIEGRL